MAGVFEGRNIVVTGGTGALGGAVLKRLVDGGAICHVPSSHAPGPGHDGFAGNERVKLTAGIDLTDASAVDAFYAGIPELWASIHLAGGFAMAPIGETSVDDFSKMMDMNAMTVFLCCKAASLSMLASGTAGRIVNVTARPGLDPRKGAGMIAYAASKAAVAAITVALAEEVKGKRHTGQCSGAVDARHAGQPGGHAQGGFFKMGRSRRRRGGHLSSRVAAEHGDERRAGSSLRPRLTPDRQWRSIIPFN